MDVIMFDTVMGIVCRNSSTVCDSRRIGVMSTSSLRALARGLSDALESLKDSYWDIFEPGVHGPRSDHILCNWGSL